MPDKKVTLPREVADELDNERNFGKGNIDILTDILESDSSPAITDYINRGGGTFDKLLSALVNGYTAEATPEEKVREYYAEIGRLAEGARERSESDKVSSLLSESCGVVHTLNLLGITIEGVNA